MACVEVGIGEPWVSTLALACVEVGIGELCVSTLVLTCVEVGIGEPSLTDSSSVDVELRFTTWNQNKSTYSHNVWTPHIAYGIYRTHQCNEIN